MTTTQPALRDMLTIRDYLRERIDELVAINVMVDAQAIAREVNRLNVLISKAEAEADA